MIQQNLNEQIGGNHYKMMKIQPIVLITRTDCDFLQGSIIKYISRYKNKNGKEDIEKAKHCACLAESLCNTHIENNIHIGQGYSYAKTNGLNGLQTDIIIAALQRDWATVILKCDILIKKEYLT